MNYSEGLRLSILKILEKDIYWLSKQFFIPGYDPEDIAQELRLTVWEESPKYNPYRADVDTWGKMVLKTKLKHLYRDTCHRDKRKVIIFTRHFGLYGNDEKNENPKSNPTIP